MCVCRGGGVTQTALCYLAEDLGVCVGGGGGGGWSDTDHSLLPG